MEAAWRSEIRDGMRIDWDVPIAMDDGVVLRADVFRPIEEGRYATILSHGPYAKWLHFAAFRPEMWQRVIERFPEAEAGSSSRYQNWEVVDPEKWVPDGYVVVRVDSRGTGRSPGVLDPWSARETRDFAACVDWAGEQSWSNGKVGLSGISYYAMNQWQVAALQPKHLAAICVWEGSADFYRDVSHHGGIHSTFLSTWTNTVYPFQHGKGSRGQRSTLTGDWIAGPETLTEEELAANRREIGAEALANTLATDDYWASRLPDFTKITVPLLSCGNWGGQGLHPRGNFEGYLAAASQQKWLEVHGLEHWTLYYADYGTNLQKRFFGYFLQGRDTKWSDQAPVHLHVRHPGERFVERQEKEWPLARTVWTERFLQPDGMILANTAPTVESSVAYAGFGDGVTFMTEPLADSIEITGPLAARLFVSSETVDADLFVVVRVFAPDMRELTFHGALDPLTPIANGWLRASHRKLDPARSQPYRPWHTHDEIQPLEPGRIYEVEIEIWPTCVVIPKDYRFGFSVRGRDYRYPGVIPPVPGIRSPAWTGVGPFQHTDGAARPPAIYGGKVTLHCGPDHPARLLLPVIPG
jgi:predicted acyl esterase